jgi:membrane dipeptidase
MTSVTSLLLAVSTCAVATAVVFAQGSEDPAAKARRIHKEAIVIDTHIDTTEVLGRPGWKFEERHEPPSSAAGRRDGNHVDLPRMRQGGLGGAFFSVWIPGTTTGPQAVKEALDEFDHIHTMVDTHPADVSLCVTADQVRAAHKAGRIAVLIGVEGGHMIADDLSVLREFARLGARYLTLTHTVNVSWADSSGEAGKADGLTPFGKDVIRELNRLGMMVDVSHVADKTFWDALAVIQAPIIASHSGSRAICGHPRNLTDEMLKALAAKGGVAQVNFMEGYLDQALYEEQEKRRPEMTKLRQDLAKKYPKPEDREALMNEFRAAMANVPTRTVVSWEKIIEHIDHIVKVVGPDHVGIGSDFDGATMPQGMDDCSQLPKITEALVRRGYTETDIKKILGGNILRVMDQVQKAAQPLNGAR